MKINNSSQPTRHNKDVKRPTIQPKPMLAPVQESVYTGGGLSAQASLLQRTPAGQRPALIHRMHRLHGNRHVQRVIHNLQQNTIQREPDEEEGGGWLETASDMWNSTTETISDTWEGTKELASDTWEGTKELASDTWEGTKELASDTWEGTKSLAKDVKDGTVSTWQTIVNTSKFDDLDATMYRVTKQGEDYLVEAVVRGTTQDGTVFYMATGRVTDYKEERPIIQPYPEPINLGDWAPRVTHVNGIMATPQSGITSAQALAKAIHDNMTKDGVAVEKDVPSVLYTYSKTEGFVTDLIDCVSGKLNMRDDVIRSQEMTMLDAIKAKKPLSVSAHSRGSIKTDVAVQNVHKQLMEPYIEPAYDDPRAIQIEQEVIEYYTTFPDDEVMVSPEMMGDIARRDVARRIASQQAWQEFQQYIQVVYAGNAVWFPEPVTELVVTKRDYVSHSVGRSGILKEPDVKKFKKIESSDGMEGHGFDVNYADTVGKWIAEHVIANPSQPKGE